MAVIRKLSFLRFFPGVVLAEIRMIVAFFLKNEGKLSSSCNWVCQQSCQVACHVYGCMIKRKFSYEQKHAPVIPCIRPHDKEEI